MPLTNASRAWAPVDPPAWMATAKEARALCDEEGWSARESEAGAVGGRDDTADDCRSEGAADLSGEVVQRRSHPLLCLGQSFGDGGRGGRHGCAHAYAEGDEARQDQQVRTYRSRLAR